MQVMSSRLVCVVLDGVDVSPANLLPHLPSGPAATGMAFDGSRDLAAYADFIAGGPLVDFKAGQGGSRRKDGTRPASLARSDLYQLLRYTFMDYTNTFRLHARIAVAYLIIWSYCSAMLSPPDRPGQRRRQPPVHVGFAGRRPVQPDLVDPLDPGQQVEARTVEPHLSMAGIEAVLGHPAFATAAYVLCLNARLGFATTSGQWAGYGPDGSMSIAVMTGSRSQPVDLPWLSTVIAMTGATGMSPLRRGTPRLAALRIDRRVAAWPGLSP